MKNINQLLLPAVEKTAKTNDPRCPHYRKFREAFKATWGHYPRDNQEEK